MKKSKLHLPLLLGILILFSCIALPSIQTTINSNEHDHDDHLQSSYMPCECGKPGCTSNVFTCPWSLGVPRPAPILSQPPSPDGDGEITLYWTSSYGVTSYKVYISDAESGPYTLIATTTSLHYTDTTTTGTWWYYVRAYNNNGYRPSNKVSVEVYLPPEPTILIGSTQRFFPHDETSRLGFTFYSVFANSIPMIELSINETEPYTGDVTIKIKIDMTVAWSTNIDMDFTEVFQSQFNQLSIEGTHQIVVELSNGGGPNDIYRLEYLAIKNLHFREYELRNDDTYGPTKLVGFGPYQWGDDPNDYDIGFIGVNSILPFAAATNGEINTPYPSFFSSIETEFDRVPIVGECMWIESIEVQYRIISPDGTPIIESRMQESGSICTSHSTDEILSPEVEAILEAIDLAISIGSLITSFVDLLLPISWIAKFLGLMQDSPDTEDYYYIEDGWYGAKWVNGDNIYYTPTGKLAREVGMRFYWSAKLPQTGPDIYGPYQVQEVWKVNIYGGNSGHIYTFECDNYMNFIYTT